MTALADVAAARAALSAGTAPLAALSDALDRALAETALAMPPPPGRWTLLALGGYGRREMCPQSDVDLQFLVAGRPAAYAPFVQACLHVWWNEGLRLGYATRNESESVALAKADHRTAMTLLDARVVAGDPKLAESLARTLRKRVYEPRRAALVASIVAERAERHERFGDTVFLLEPDIKNGEGGLRDLHGARWAAQVVRGGLALAGCGLAAAELLEVDAAHETLLRFRNALHGLAGRKVDRLRFEYQEGLCAALGHSDVASAMQRYWRAARLIRSTSRRALDVLDAEVRGRTPPAIVAPSPLRPEQLAAVFRQSSERFLPIDPAALGAVAEAIPRVDERVRRDPQVAEDLFVVLTAPKDRALPLGLMHDVGLLSALVPEFGPTTGLYQRNVFHVYTVDVHSIHGVAWLKALAAEAAPDHGELRHRVMAGLDEGHRRELFLAMLLHDIGKGGTDPARARDAALRLGLGEARADRVAFLVREHLLMALLAQTRDILDEVTVRHLAREVTDKGTLAMLFLLTFADMSSANPALLTSWKSALLDELFTRTDALLSGGLDVFADERGVVHARRGEILRLHLGSEPEHPTRATQEVDTFLSLLPTRYAVVTPAADVVTHMALCQELATSPAALRFEPAPGGTGTVTVSCQDAPGLLARLSGALAAHGVNILGAEVHGRTDGIVVDVFRVMTPVPWEALALDMRRVIAGEVEPGELLRRLERPSPLGERPTPPVPTDVSADDAASEQFTVIDVVARDRPGLLYRLTRALHRLGLDIRLARVTTEGHTARDAFYVERVGGGKESDPGRLAEVLEAVRAALDEAL